MSREFHFQFPLAEEQVRELQVGDLVYLSGLLFTMRDMGHRRAVEMLKRGEELPFDLASGAIWHCGPIVKQNEAGKWQVVSAGSTTSSRFTELGSNLIEMQKVRCIVGKGTMNALAVKTMQKEGSCFLNSTGGCASLYAQQIEEVTDVFWTDLGLPEATWVMKVKDFGPLVVGIDSKGHSLFETIKKSMDANLNSIFQQAKIDPGYNLSYLPKRVAAKGKP